MRKFLKQSLTIAIMFSIIITNIFVSITSANENFESYEDELYNIMKVDNVITIMEKKTGKEVKLIIDNDDKGELVLPSGEKKQIIRNDKNDICLDKKIVMKSSVQYEVLKQANSKAKSKKKWNYLRTYYYNTKTKGDLESIALGLFSLMPYVGTVATIAAIITTARNMGAPILYVKVKEYYYTGYSKYKYENYFYADKKRKKLIKHTTEIKYMW